MDFEFLRNPTFFNKKVERNSINIFEGIVHDRENVIMIAGLPSSGKTLVGASIVAESPNTSLYINASNSSSFPDFRLKNCLYAQENRYERLIRILKAIDRRAINTIVIDDIANIDFGECEDRYDYFNEGIKKIVDISRKLNVQLILINRMKQNGNIYGLSYQLKNIIPEIIEIDKISLEDAFAEIRLVSKKNRLAKRIKVVVKNEL